MTKNSAKRVLTARMWSWFAVLAAFMAASTATPAPALLNVSYDVDDDFGGWIKTLATHFADGGIFGQIYIK